jgi:hypothetical protein
MGFLSENNVRFLNREGEIRYVRRFVASPTAGILGIHGPGGIGKTVLAWWSADECTRQGIPCAYINLAHFPFADSVDVLRETAEQLGRLREFAGFWELLSRYHSHFQSRFLSIQAQDALPPADLLQERNRVIAAYSEGMRQLASAQQVVALIFDNFDAIGRADRHSLEAEVFARLSELPAVKIFVVSRCQNQWREPALDQKYSVLHLLPFDEDYARDLTSLVWPDLLEREAYLQALKVSRGHPYSVVRMAKIGARNFHLNEADLYQRLLEELWANVITRFMLKGIGASLQALLSQISIVRAFDVSGLKYFSDRTGLFTDAQTPTLIEVMDTLNHEVSAIRFDEVRKGYQLQLPIRPVSLELHRLSQALEALNQVALEFYTTYLEHLPPGFDEWRRCIIEMTYHQGVIGKRPEDAKTLLAQALTQLRAARDLEAAIKLRDELGGDWDLPSGVWQDVFTYFEQQELGSAAA